MKTSDVLIEAQNFLRYNQRYTSSGHRSDADRRRTCSCHAIFETGHDFDKKHRKQYGQVFLSKPNIDSLFFSERFSRSCENMSYEEQQNLRFDMLTLAALVLKDEGK